MLSEDDIRYAIDSTKVIMAPSRRINTFGATSFRFLLVTEAMDRVNEIKIRDGRIEADRPTLITPRNMNRLLLEGFGESGAGFADWLASRGASVALLKYGFQIRKTEVSEEIVHDKSEVVLGRLEDHLKASNDPLSSLIYGVEEGWEISLLKFTVDLAQQSAGGNLDDFRNHGQN